MRKELEAQSPSYIISQQNPFYLAIAPKSAPSSVGRIGRRIKKVKAAPAYSQEKDTLVLLTHK